MLTDDIKEDDNLGKYRVGDREMLYRHNRQKGRQKMIYPRFVRQGDTIAVTAVSDGVSDELDRLRFENGRKKLNEKGIEVQFTNNVFRVEELGRSSSGRERAEEWNRLCEDTNISAIISAKGGNFLNEMLEYVDFETFREKPKWFQGYSDNTWLVHTLTTKYDIATIYGSNFGEFGMETWHESVRNNYDILTGNLVEQKSFDKYQTGFADRMTGLEGYQEDSRVEWRLDSQTLKKTDKVKVSGRLIGGCLDVLLFAQGTKYDGTLEFIEKYKEDGVIWYLETFESSAENLMMFLWKLKEIGWFQYTKAVMLGRPLFFRDFDEVKYDDAVLYALGSLDIPIIFDCDFGHRGPRFTIINGAKAQVETAYGKGKLTYFAH